MSLVEWDAELEAVAREVEQVRQIHGRKRLSGHKTLLATRVAMIQAQINVDRYLERIRKLTQRDFMLLPRERTLLHWGGLYLEATQKLLALRAKHRTRQLWLRLIKARLSGSSDGRGDMDADDLVALSVRQANLSKTEGYLADALVKLRRRKKELTRRYEALGVVSENHVAGGSLGTRLGLSPEDAFASPPVRALSSYIRRVTAPVLDAPGVKRYLDAQQRTRGKSDGLLGLCKAVVLSRLSDAEAEAHGPRPGKNARDLKVEQRALDKFQLTMQQLDELETETRDAWDRLLSATPEAARPVVKGGRVGVTAGDKPTNR